MNSEKKNVAKGQKKQNHVHSTKNCRVVLNRITVHANDRSMTSSSSGSLVAVEHRQVVQAPQQPNASTIAPAYKNRMKKAINQLKLTLQATITENMSSFISDNETQLIKQLCQNKMFELTAAHAVEIKQLRINYEAKLAKSKNERNRAVKNAKKKQWCSGCGKGTAYKMMMFCNNKCQKKHM